MAAAEEQRGGTHSDIIFENATTGSEKTLKVSLAFKKRQAA
jgi:hypothetical protein